MGKQVRDHKRHDRLACVLSVATTAVIVLPPLAVGVLTPIEAAIIAGYSFACGMIVGMLLPLVIRQKVDDA